MEEQTDHKRMMELLAENNRILKRIHRNNMVSLWVTILWYAAIIGLPFAIYFYVLQPYFEKLGADYEVFKQGMQEIPGIKGFSEAFGTYEE